MRSCSRTHYVLASLILCYVLVDILGVDILGVDMLGRTRLSNPVCAILLLEWSKELKNYNTMFHILRLVDCCQSERERERGRERRKEGKGRRKEGGRKEKGREERGREEGREERREERRKRDRRKEEIVMCSFVLVMFVPQCCTFTLSIFSLLSLFSPLPPQWPKPWPGAEAAINVGEGAQQAQEVHGSKRDCAHM